MPGTSARAVHARFVGLHSPSFTAASADERVGGRVGAGGLRLAICAQNASSPTRSHGSGTGKAAASADLGALAAAHKPNPADVAAAPAYARALRVAGARAEALAVLETCAGKAKDRGLTLERGLLTLELGQSEKAERLLRLADDPDAPDWRLNSALGAALAAPGQAARGPGPVQPGPGLGARPPERAQQPCPLLGARRQGRGGRAAVAQGGVVPCGGA